MKKDKWKLVILILVLTWVIQFIPIMLGMDLSNASLSSGDLSGIIYAIGGAIPSVIAILYVLITYSKEDRKDYFKRCFIPNKECLKYTILVLLLISFEVFCTQTIAKIFFNATPLEFSGLKTILSAPYMLFYYLFWGIMSGPINEEFAWRGLLQDKFTKDNGFIKGTIILGLIWAIWHLPLYFYPMQAQYGYLHTNIWLVVIEILSNISYALVIAVFYILTKRRTFIAFIIHMFFNIILTGIMVYPWSEAYGNLTPIVSTIINTGFFVIVVNTKLFKDKLKSINY